MSFLPPDYKLPEAYPSYNYKPKVLELIARTLGDEFSGSVVVSLLKSAGIPDSEIDYPNTKWKTILGAFKYAMNEWNENHITIESVIEEFLDPLSHNVDEEKEKVLYEKIKKILKYADLVVVKSENRYVILDKQDFETFSIDKFEEEANDPDSEYNNQYYKKIEEEKNRKKDFEIIIANKEKIQEIREYHQAYIDLLEIFCNNPSRPTDNLNSHYIFLKKHLQKLIDGLRLNKITYIYTPFRGDLYSAEKEWGQDIIRGPISWDKIRPELYSMHSWITQRCNVVENHKQQSDNKKKLAEITDFISQIRTKKTPLKEHQKTMKIEISKIPELTIKNVEDDATVKNKKKIYLPKFSATTWSKVQIRFIDESTVYITADKKTATANYEGLGFCNDKNGKPNTAWKFLLELSKNKGETPIIQSPIPDTIKNQKRVLSDRLKTIFKNDTDPFDDFSQSKTYRIKIGLIPPTQEQGKDKYGINDYLDETMTSQYEVD